MYFLSWSGERSLYVAKFLHDWFPRVLHRTKPWLSDIDIDKGTLGLDEIKKTLSGTKVGILCLTPENRESLWMSYEAGVLAKEIDEKNRICPFLLGGLQLQHLKGPLGMFQCTKSEKEDSRKLIHTINKAVGDDPVPDSHLDIIFDKLWPDFEAHLEKLPKTISHQ
jgi:hypothetical protein